MSKLASVMQLVAAPWVVFSRIERQSLPKGQLHGIKWVREGGLQGEGRDGLPSLQPFPFDLETAIFAGGFKVGGHARSNTPVETKITLRLELRTATTEGYFRRDPSASIAKKGHMEWLALVMDAIETNDAGKPDALLNGTVAEPVSFVVREGDQTSLSIASYLEVILAGRPVCRHERSYTFPTALIVP